MSGFYITIIRQHFQTFPGMAQISKIFFKYDRLKQEFVISRKHIFVFHSFCLIIVIKIEHKLLDTNYRAYITLLIKSLQLFH